MTSGSLAPCVFALICCAWFAHGLRMVWASYDFGGEVDCANNGLIIDFDKHSAVVSYGYSKMQARSARRVLENLVRMVFA